MLTSFIKYALHPLILISVLTLWVLNPAEDWVYLVALLGVQLVLGTLEHIAPARPNWIIHAKLKVANIMLVLFLLTLSVTVVGLYDSYLVRPLAELRAGSGLDIWPHTWPLIVQLLMVFILTEFIWYWIHRAEHRWYAVWRISGHGAHHSFKKLNALNFGLNHPFELLFLALPAALIEITFGVGPAAAGAAVLTVCQASIVHSNLAMSSQWIDLVFTTNRHHLHHHSIVLEESNTNYGCATLIWDRVFGTFVDADTVECGTGATEPGLVDKLMMPIREPEDTAIAPS